jgi:RNA polymerase sigma factor (sigma-70 family)
VDVDIAAPEESERLLALDEALTKLAGQDPKVAELVKLRYFAGLTIKRAAEILGISPRTADHYWAYAKAWLREEIEDD